MTSQEKLLSDLLLAGIKAHATMAKRKRKLASPEAGPRTPPADALAEWQPLLQEDEKQADSELAKCIKYLASVDDYATARDGHGFNKMHAEFGQSIARIPEPKWSPKQRFFAWQICVGTYRNQLTKAGFDPASIPMPNLLTLTSEVSIEKPKPFRHIGIDPAGPGFMIATANLEREEFDASRYAITSLIGRSYMDGIRYSSRIPKPHWIISGDKPSAESVKQFLAGFATDHGWTIGKGVYERIYELCDRADHMVALSRAHAPTDNFALRMESLYGKELYEYQLAGVEYTLEAVRPAVQEWARTRSLAGIGCFVCDDMGLGKTLESLVAAAEAFAEAMIIDHSLTWDDFRVMVVAPAAAKIGWAKEVKASLPWLSTQIIRGQDPQELWANVVVVNPNLLRMEWNARKWNEATGQMGDYVPTPLVTMFLGIDWFALIGDESHQYKNYHAERTRAMLLLSRSAPVRFWLSGTPILNRPDEFTPQLEALSIVDHLGGRNRFLQRYGSTRNGEIMKELNLKLRERGYLRREKVDSVFTPEGRIVELKFAPAWLRNTLSEFPYSEWDGVCQKYGYELLRGVFGQLPDKVRSVSSIEIDRERYLYAVQNFMKWYAENVADLDDANERIARAARGRALVELIKIKWYTAKLKLPGAKAFLQEFYDENPDEKVVYAVHHRDIHEEIVKEFVDTFGPEFVAQIKGGQSEVRREEEVMRFQEDPRCKLMVMTEAGNVAITLTAAKTVMHHELGWTPAITDQIEDRVWGRINDLHGANVFFLIAENTIDEKVAAMLDAKRVVVDAATEGSDAPPESMVMALIADIRRTAQEGK